MTKFVSILRGINVSGHKRIKMVDLKNLYEKLNFTNVITYIQSGNVIFECLTDSSQNIKENIETAIKKSYGFDVYVDVRVVEEFNDALKNLPFKGFDLDKDGGKILLTFLEREPDSEKANLLKSLAAADEELLFGNRVFYLHCPNGYGKTKLSNTLIERKLRMRATTRNLKTVTKLSELSS